MPFQKPGLFTVIDPDNYQAEINLNFGRIDQAFTTIQNDLSVLFGSPGGGVSNLSWVGQVLVSDGPIGYDSWVPVFTQDTDGAWSLSLEHQAPSGSSEALISGVLHRSSSVLSWSLDAIAPAGDGPHRIVIGLNSAGAPGVEQQVVANENPTDDPELPLYSFSYARETDGALVQDLRRETPWHADEAAWSEVRDRPTVLQVTLTRVDTARWPDDDTDAVFLIPFDCEVVGASAYLSHEPVAGEVVEVKLLRYGWTAGTGNDRSEEVVEGTWLWGDDTDALTVRTVNDLPAKAPTTQLLAGDYVNVQFVQSEAPDTDLTPDPANPDVRRMLTVSLRIRPIQHAPRKSVT